MPNKIVYIHVYFDKSSNFLFKRLFYFYILNRLLDTNMSDPSSSSSNANGQQEFSCGYGNNRGYNPSNNQQSHNQQFNNMRHEQGSYYTQKRKFPNNSNQYNNRSNNNFQNAKYTKGAREQQQDPQSFYNPGMVKDPWENL